MQNGERLRTLRKQRGMTQKDVAELLQTSRQYYSEYELEKYELPLRHLETLADLYQVSTDYLLGRAEDAQAEDAPEKDAPEVCAQDR